MSGVLHALMLGHNGAALNLDGHANTNTVSFARGFVFKSDGTVEYYDDYADAGQIDSATDWIIPNALAPGPYEVRCTVNSGSQDSGLTPGTWYALTSDRAFYDDTTGLFNYTIDIRIGSTIVASGTYTGST